MNQRYQHAHAIAGQTPFFLYDKQSLCAQVYAFREHMPEQLKLHYAIKANPMPQLVSYLGSMVDGFDTASLKEIHLALAGIQSDDQHISLAGPGKSNAELKAALAANILIHIESLGQLSTLIELGRSMGVAPKISLRLSPEFQIKGFGMKMGGVASPFGLPTQDMDTAIQIVKENDLHITGLHLFPGSQVLNEATLIDAWGASLDAMSDCIHKIESYGLPPISEATLGGGIGIPYFEKDTEMNMHALGEGLRTHFSRHQSWLDNIRISMELGRFLAGPCGHYVTQVVDIKHDHDHTLLVVNGGMHHHLANSGNLGQVLRRNMPVELVPANPVNNDQTGSTQVVSVFGPLCTPLDIVAKDISVPSFAIGDYVVVHLSGAYGPSASPSGFLSHDKAIELLI